MTLLDLNTHFGLNVETKVNTRNSAGCYISNVVYISNDLERFVGVQSTRPNNFGNCLYPNVMSLVGGNLESVCLAHEFGHAIQNNFRWDSDFREVRDLCDKIAPKCISVYSGLGLSNPMASYSEAFAEVFALFIVKPELLHSMSEELFHKMNDFYISFL